MKFELRKTKIKFKDLSSFNKSLEQNFQKIQLFQKLILNYDTLTLEEFSKLAGCLYTFQITTKDVEDISKKILNTSAIKYTSKLLIDIPYHSKFLTVRNFHNIPKNLTYAKAYYPASMCLPIDRIYSDQELKDLILNKKIVLHYFRLSYYTKDNYAKNVNLNDFVTLKDVSWNNFGSYQEFIFPLIKAVLTIERLANDKELIVQEIQKGQKYLKEYNFQNKSNESIILARKNYS